MPGCYRSTGRTFWPRTCALCNLIRATPHAPRLPPCPSRPLATILQGIMRDGAASGEADGSTAPAIGGRVAMAHFDRPPLIDLTATGESSLCPVVAQQATETALRAIAATLAAPRRQLDSGRRHHAKRRS
jgi:hypothetical protein